MDRVGQIFALFAALTGCTTLGPAGQSEARGAWYTYWNGPKQAGSANPLAFSPAVHLPPDPSRFRWQLELAPGDRPGSGIPSFSWDYLAGHFQAVGQLQPGVVVRIDGLRLGKGIHYYLVRELTAEPKSAVWVDGYHLKVVGEALPSTAP